MHNYLTCRTEIKAYTQSGIITGYASTFDVVDSQKDIIAQGAFSESIKKHINAGYIKFLWQHKYEEPIGIFNLIAEDKHGLYIEARLLLDLQRAREAYTLLKAGVLSHFSIGYTPVEYHFDKENDLRVLTRVNLWEISLVTFPANEGAKVTGIKNGSYCGVRFLHGDLDRLMLSITKSLSILNG